MLKRLLVAVPLAVLATGGLFLLMRMLTAPPLERIYATPPPEQSNARPGTPPGDEPPPRLADGPVTPLVHPRPEYPSCGVGDGTVELDFEVQTNGSVSDIRVLSTTSPCFADAAKIAVLGWRYRPKVVNGRAVPSRIRVTIDFAVPERRPIDDIGDDFGWERNGEASPIVRLRPQYPSCATGEGEVILDFLVEPDGSVGDVKVISATSECFAKAAVEATKRWRYRPKTVDGQPVRSGRMRVKLVYRQE